MTGGSMVSATGRVPVEFAALPGLNHPPRSRAAFRRSFRLHASWSLRRIVAPVCTFPFVAWALRSSRARSSPGPGCPAPAEVGSTFRRSLASPCSTDHGGSSSPGGAMRLGSHRCGAASEATKKRIPNEAIFPPWRYQECGSRPKNEPNRTHRPWPAHRTTTGASVGTRRSSRQIPTTPKKWGNAGDLSPDENRQA